MTTAGGWVSLAEADRLETELEAELRERLKTRAGPPARGRRDRAGVPRVALPHPGSAVSIIVPVHDALGPLRSCLAAIARNTTVPARLLLIDDASTDPEVAQALERFARLPNVTRLINSQNGGFSATVNRGLRAAGSEDVVVLNSDTEVTPGWLGRLVTTAYSDPRIGSVTPVSGNAGAFSVPLIGERNPLPAHLDGDAMGRLIAQRSLMLRPSTPTANGFCMYLRRAMLDDVGLLDADAFPEGYGEENDLCMRALEAGWRHVVDDRVYVHHVREASFGPRRQALLAAGRRTVDARHSRYTELVREFVAGDMVQVRAAVAEAVREPDGAASAPVRPRVLFCVHEGRGGVPMTTEDLMRGLHDRYDCWLLRSTGAELVLSRMGERGPEEVERWTLDGPLSSLDFTRQDYRRIVGELLDRHAFELVHVRHLFKHTFDLPRLAAARGIALVVSAHDYYLVCPTVHLLDDRGDWCGGRCTDGTGDCQVPHGLWPARGPALKHRFVHDWRDEVTRALADADAFVTTSAGAREVHRRALAPMSDRPFAVIEHGRELARTAAAVAPTAGGEVRIAVPGNLDRHKGAELMRAILAADRSHRIRFELLGDGAEGNADLGRSHGRYAREDLGRLLEEIAPAFVGIFSVWAETYSHVLSEAWAAGVPVIATALGAPAERVARQGGGWLIDPADPVGAADRILAVADDAAQWERGRAQATVADIRDVAAMAEDYAALYDTVLLGRRTFGDAGAGRGAAAPVPV
jgi:GT2 family glycosyltransferase/glycosyltransferase involved in cell wall biosynthesis